MTYAETAALALGLDLLLGDPRWLPHPVKGIGRAIAWMEGRLRRMLPHRERTAGVLLVLGVVGLTWGLAELLVQGSRLMHSSASAAVHVFLIYVSLAPRDLWDHAMAVHRALSARDLTLARQRVGRMVGRDVTHLDEAGVVRAAVESVAEGTTDGVVAPLFFAVLGGGPLALAYRAVNTLDSMVGHPDPPYRDLGWASARLDDLVNYLPARLVACLMPLAGGILRYPVVSGYRTLWRDGRKHASPNAGLPEAAMAGLLGIRLGGPKRYRGKLRPALWLGVEHETPRPLHIRAACRLMAVTSLLAFLLLCALAAGIEAIN